MHRGADRWAEYARARALVEEDDSQSDLRRFHRAVGTTTITIEVAFTRIAVHAAFRASEHVAYARRVDGGLGRAHLAGIELPIFTTGDPVFDEQYDVVGKNRRSVMAVFEEATRASLLSTRAIWYQDVRGAVEILVPNFEQCEMLDQTIDLVSKGAPWRPPAFPYR